MKKAAISLSIFAALVAAPIFAAGADGKTSASKPASRPTDKRALRVLESMDKKNADFSSLRCKITWIVKAKWTRKPRKKAMTLAVLKVPMPTKENPGRTIPLMRLSQKTPYVTEIYVTRKEAVKYEPDNKFAQKVSIDWNKAEGESSQQALEVLLAPSNVTKNFKVTYERAEQREGKECDVLRIVPASDRVRSDYKLLMLWVSKETRLPLYMVGEKVDGVTTDEIRFYDVTLNAKVGEGEFKFKPPKGVVVDNVNRIELWN